MLDLNETGKKLGAEGMDLIREVCDVAYTRLPGSEDEDKAQKFLAGKLKKLGAEEVVTRDFKVHQRFFRWWPVVSISLFLVSMIFYLIFPLMALLLTVLAILNLYFKIFSYSFLDVLFPNKPSSNVIGKLKAKGAGEASKPKHLIIFGGHTDSNYEYPIGRKYGTKGLVRVVVPTLLLMVVWLFATILRFIITLVTEGSLVILDIRVLWVFTQPDIFYYIALIGTPFVTWVGFNMVSNRPVPGANDNLSGVVVSMEVLKFFAKNPTERPDNVEIWAVCFGSEEGGMMGSKRMAKDVQSELEAGTFPVDADHLWIVNFDTVGSDGPIHIATKEPMYRVKGYEPRVYEMLSQAAGEAGVDHKVKSLSAGGTDSAPFGRLGIPAAAILCLDGSKPLNWHTREDAPENVDVTGLVNCIKTSIQFVNKIGEYN